MGGEGENRRDKSAIVRGPAAGLKILARPAPQERCGNPPHSVHQSGAENLRPQVPAAAFGADRATAPGENPTPHGRAAR